MEFSFVTQSAIDMIFFEYFSAKPGIIISAVVVNHIKPLCPVIVPIFVTLGIGVISVLVPKSQIDKALGAKIRTGPKYKLVLIS
jgi:hypothetical protein